ncbi:MAG: histidine phosphatase family protein [Spirochaetales bacterium]|nr:histidine phosphatase family protein [Spirochaetales bacterium]
MHWILIRHGETLFNAEGRFQGRHDSPLSPRGEEQTRSLGVFLGQYLKDRPVLRWFVSPLGRTQQTSLLLRSLIPFALPDPQLSDDLVEISCGEWEGRLHQDVPEDLLVPLRDDPRARYPGGESREDVTLRARNFFETQGCVSGITVIVSHGNFLQCLTDHLLDLNLQFASRSWLDNTGIVELVSRSGNRPYRLLRWNATAHLSDHP